MNQKNIIIFIIVLFVLCSGYLFFVSDQGLTSDTGKNWWALYFEDPKGASLDFVIENHSSNDNFHFEVTAQKNKLQEGDVEIRTGENKKIELDLPEAKNTNITVSVSDGSDKKEIYKNLK